MFLNRDYDNFVQRMGSFEQELSINDEDDETYDNKPQGKTQEILKNIGDYRIK